MSLTRNVLVEDGLVNSAQGILLNFPYGLPSSHLSTII